MDSDIVTAGPIHMDKHGHTYHRSIHMDKYGQMKLLLDQHGKRAIAGAINLNEDGKDITLPIQMAKYGERKSNYYPLKCHSLKLSVILCFLSDKWTLWA